MKKRLSKTKKTKQNSNMTKEQFLEQMNQWYDNSDTHYDDFLEQFSRDKAELIASVVSAKLFDSKGKEEWILSVKPKSKEEWLVDIILKPFNEVSIEYICR